MRKEVHGGNIYKYNHKVYDFSANLNPLGMPGRVKQAIIESIDNYESYPDPFNTELVSSLSDYHKVDGMRICPGNGAADIIFRIPLALRPSKALIVAPTFAEYEEALKMVDCFCEYYMLTEESEFIVGEDLTDCIDKSLDMVFICNPNNPTGIPVKRELMLSIAEKCRENDVTLVVDECFTEFLDNEEEYSIMNEIEELHNVIILKAFTKIYAMAGLRLGYCICSDISQADMINGCLQPWSVSTPAAKAGVAALEVEGFVEKTKGYIRENREFLINGLRSAGLRVYASKANYIFFQGPENLKGKLEEKDILIRSCANYVSLGQTYYRIAVRTENENIVFIKALTEICGKN